MLHSEILDYLYNFLLNHLAIIIVISTYTLIIFIYSLIIYFKYRPHYKPLYFQYDQNSPVVNVHDLYDEFKLKDKLSFWRIFLGSWLLFPIRIPSGIFFFVAMNIQLNYHLKRLEHHDTDPNERKIIANIIQYWPKLLFFVNGITIIDRTNEFKSKNKENENDNKEEEKKYNNLISEESNETKSYEEIYKKYLGDDYDFTDQKYSLIICNHIGFFEVLINMVKHQSGFFAKKEIENYAFVGPIAKAMNCLFVKRESDEDRAKIFEILEKRAKDYYEGKILAPLVLFPEGTTTCGRNLLKFKKGAFYSLLPIKPEIIDVYQEDDFSLAVGSSHVVLNFFRSMAYFRHRLYYIDLPVIRPTEFMFEKYKDLGKEKWQIFAEVTRKILCEIGDLKPSNKHLRDLNRYKKAMKNGNYTSEDFLSLCNEKDPVLNQLGIKV
jgi:1-acyl-sn-glycerol-3-phosphate acyltransferase